MNDKKITEIKKKNKQTLLNEEADLKRRQATLRMRKDALQERKEDLQTDLYAAAKSGNKESEELILKELTEIREDIKEINTEYKLNSEALKSYSDVTKNKDEGKSSLVGTLFAGLGTGAAIWLGRESLKRAYASDVEGTLVNKKSLDIFNRLNPLKLIQHFKK